MRPEDRLARLSRVRAALAAGCSETAACMGARVTVAWYRRWSARPELADAPRAGRPASCELSPEDARALQHVYLKSNRARCAGSMAGAARWCAVHGLVSAPVAEAILRERADPCALPAPVRQALRGVGRHAFARYRDPKHGMGKADGIRTPGWLRMNEDGSGRLEPGQRWVFDDGTVNVGIVVPWARGGDPCSERYGCRLGRYQLLLAVDCATDAITGYAFVMNVNDAYGAADIVAAMHNIWSAAGEAPREAVLEGGSWQSARVLRFLALAGVRVVSAKGDPGQKLVESVFNRLWTLLAMALPDEGQLGRVRGEMRKESQLWMDCRAGKKDPREHFPSLSTFVRSLRQAIEMHNRKPVDSRLYGRWVPGEAYECRRREAMLPVPAALRREALPAEKVVTLKLSGVASVRWPSPHGEPHDYVFATETLHRWGGAKVRVQFDPMRVREGAFVSLAQAFRGEPAGAVLAEDARCISPAPLLEADSLHGCLDARGEARAMKKTSRALVGTVVRSLDGRGRIAQEAPEPSAPEPLERPEPVAAAPEAEAEEATDFAALETAAGVW